MNDTEIRELFSKTCVAINEYQKGAESIARDIQRINVRIKEMKLEALVAEMDKVIAGYYGGIQNAGSLVDGLTERLVELEQFVQIIEDVEAKAAKFGKIRESMKDIEKDLEAVREEISAGRTYLGEIELPKKNIDAFQAASKAVADNGPSDTVHIIYRLDDMIRAKEQQIVQNKKFLACLSEEKS